MFLSRWIPLAAILIGISHQTVVHSEAPSQPTGGAKHGNPD